MPDDTLSELIVELAARGTDQGEACFYLYDTVAMRERLTQLRGLLPHWMKLFYAVKANSNPAILQACDGIVNGFDVASLGEIRKVRAAISQSEMIFNSVGKTRREIEECLRSEDIVLSNIESLSDVSKFAKHGSALRPKRVQLRISAPYLTEDSVGTSRELVAPHKFGVRPTDVARVVEAISETSSLTLVGTHFHGRSNCQSAEEYVNYVAECIGQTDSLLEESVDSIDVGGGLGVPYGDPSVQFDWLKFSSGLRRIHDSLAGRNLILEPGRSIVGAFGYYCTEILDIKQMDDSQVALIVRGGIHHCRLPKVINARLQFDIIRFSDRSLNHPAGSSVSDCEVVVCGELGSSSDVLGRGFVTNARIGDIVVFSQCGAYAWEISHSGFLSHDPPRFYNTSEDCLHTSSEW